MAVEIKTLMAGKRIDYTQYIDDMCFSGNDDILIRKMINEVYRITRRHGMFIKKEKTEIMDSKRRQTLMNVGVNEKPKVSRGLIADIASKIIALPEDGYVERRMSLSISGQILYVKTYDVRAARYLENIFNAKIKNIYTGNVDKLKNEAIEPCNEYGQGGSKRAKCSRLTS
jgi:hypothetical protein